jgi:hypothetical protein
MVVHKRWGVAFVTSVVVLLGAPVSAGISSAQPTQLTGSGVGTIAAQFDAALKAATLTPAAQVVDVPAQPQDVSVVTVISGRDTQVNTRGFGDIGMQFQNVNVNAQILNDHISSQGNDNITNSNVGQNNVINNSGSTCPGGFCH